MSDKEKEQKPPDKPKEGREERMRQLQNHCTEQSSKVKDLIKRSDEILRQAQNVIKKESE